MKIAATPISTPIEDVNRKVSRITHYIFFVIVQHHESKREAKSTKKSLERNTLDRRVIDKNSSIDELFSLNDSL